MGVKMVLNESINQTQNTDLGQISNILSWLPRTLSEKTAELLINSGVQVSEGWASRMFLLASLIMLYIGIWILKKVHPIIKFAIIVLSLVLAIGLIYPFF